MEVASNIQPKKIGLNVRRNGPQPRIFVRSFSQITSSTHGKHLDYGREPGGKQMRLMVHSTVLSIVIRTRGVYSSRFSIDCCKLSNQQRGVSPQEHLVV